MDPDPEFTAMLKAGLKSIHSSSQATASRGGGHGTRPTTKWSRKWYGKTGTAAARPWKLDDIKRVLHKYEREKRPGALERIFRDASDRSTAPGTLSHRCYRDCLRKFFHINVQGESFRSMLSALDPTASGAINSCPGPAYVRIPPNTQ